MKMPVKVQRRLSQWVRQTLPKITPENCDDIHTDELVKLLGYGDETLEFMWEVYLAVLEIEGAILEGYMPSLKIALEDSEQPDIHVPSWSEIQQQQDPSTPPSIYLLSRASSRFPDLGERYTSSLREQPPLMPGHPDVYWFYTTFRTEEGRQHGWEFTRNVGAEYYPQSCRMGK